MARPKLLLHPGMHKTGTTAIQDSLHKNRAWLAEQGVAYPLLTLPDERPSEAHHRFSKAIVSARSVSDPDLQHYCRQIEEAADGASLTVLSAEPIYRLMLHGHPDKQGTVLQYPRIYAQRLRRLFNDRQAYFGPHRAYLERLRHLLRDFDVSVLLYLRRPDKVAESIFKTNVAGGTRTSHFMWRIRWIDWYFDYQRHIDLYRDVFGETELRIYETETKGDLVTGFYSALGLEAPPVKQTRRARLSLGNRATLWLSRARARDSSDRAHWNRTLFAAENSGNPVFAEDEPSTLWPSDAAFTAFVTRHRPAYEMGYFETPKPPGRPTTIWTRQMHRKADAAFAAWSQDNAERLERRKKARLSKYWEPDPD